ncbi:hypothetical protein [Vibrio phage PH669]|uniref:Uncharacterized protein n=1 Tax=Vibrio phage PH669 TaxID=2800823 RepID=A0A7T6ZMB9_9CAUD|nr:hypothetical protein [Vibrio phage PH669]
MAKVTTIVCDGCGEPITKERDNDSQALIRLVYPSKNHSGFEAMETNDLCSACYCKAQSLLLEILKPQAWTLHPDARLAMDVE